MKNNIDNSDKNLYTGLEVAVIGMAGRFPGAKHIHQLWDNLKNGIESLSFKNDRELQQSGVSSQVLDAPNFVKSAGGVMEDIEYFDASFFGYIPAEAEVMSPQTRIFHECLWTALEDAGYDPDLFPGLIGLYAGASSPDDWQLLALLGQKTVELDPLMASGLMDIHFLSTLISYKLNLKGPSFTLFTACSTSLAAIHLACQGLLSGDCDMALAGGIAVAAQERKGYFYTEGMINSPDGHCRAFDRKAMGTFRGDGAGIVVLKRFEDALVEGDHIYALVKGAAMNNDGIRKVGYTAPSIEGQREVICRAHQIAGVNPGDIGYVETHGTATPLGDVTEVEALTQAFNSDKKGCCGLGSVKTNFGHLDTAAGVTGFIKTVLAIRNKQIPPSLHFETPNPRIDFANSPFYVNTGLKEWQNNGKPLRAGVSSFGIGGTNIHMVLEEWPGMQGEMHLRQSARSQDQGRVSPPGTSRKYQLILLSAKTGTALEQMTKNLVEYLENHPHVNLADIAYTLQLGRKAFQYRRKLLCSDVPGAIAELFSSSPDSRKVQTHRLAGENKPIVFMFPGLGAHHVNMAKDLYLTEPVFRQEMGRCFEILKPLLGYDIKEILFPRIPVGKVNQVSEESGGEPCRDINRTEIAYMVLFILEYSLARLLMAWGITPRAMIGYSFGEYAAACISGVFTLEDVLKLLVSRGKSMAELPRGMMLSVPLTVKEVQPLLNDGLTIGIDNGSTCVISGPEPAVRALEKQMKEKLLLCMPINSTHAVHSGMMDPILKEFVQQVGTIPLQAPVIPYISTVTGDWIKVKDAVSPQYWARQLRERVHFARGMEKLFKEPGTLFIEVGPGRDLSAMVKREIKAQSLHQVINLLGHPGLPIPDDYHFLDKIGLLWLYGAHVDWKGYYSQQGRRRLSLPTYPFEGQRFWKMMDDFKSGKLSQSSRVDRRSGAPADVNRDMAHWFYVPTWKRTLPCLSMDSVAAESISNQISWLIFLDESGFGAKLVERLHQAEPAGKIITVRQGEHFSRPGEHHYTVNPGSKEDYHRLIEDIRASSGTREEFPGVVLHLWSLTPGSEDTKDIGEPGGNQYFKRCQETGYYSLLYLVQAFAKPQFAKTIAEIKDDSPHIRFEILSNHIYAVTGQEMLSAEKATILGPCKTIPQEYPNISCRSIDITLPGPGTLEESRLIDQLIGEITTRPKEFVVAYRGNSRWVQYFEPLHLEPRDHHPMRLRERGVYLITGGLGKDSFMRSKYLAETLNARLVLISRTQLPERHQWTGYLKRGNNEDETCTKIKRVMQLESLGAEVLVLSADVSDFSRMKQVIDRIDLEFGELNGVIHAAGMTTIELTRLIRDVGTADSESHFTPKVYGLYVLEKVLAGRDLDFCLLTSSLVSMTGGIGLTAYSAASIFMDTFVHRHNRYNPPTWTSLNWVGLPEHETVEGFKRVLAMPSLDQVAVAPGDLNRQVRERIDPQAILDRTRAESANKEKRVLYTRPNLSTPYIPPRDEVEAQLTAIWERFFGIEKIGVHDDLYELGGDSLKAMNIISIIQKDLHTAIPLKEFFESSTIEKVANYIKNTKSTGKPEDISIKSAEKKEYYCLSSAQKRLYILQHMNLTGTAYNSPMMEMLGVEIHQQELEWAFKGLIDRHESLRTAIISVDDEPVQEIEDPDKVVFNLEYHESTQDKIGELFERFIKPFDLSEPPLFRAALVKVVNPGFGYVLMFDIHHVVTDLTSWDIITRELKAFYAGQDLPPLRLQFKDFSQWQNNRQQQELIKQQEAYWLDLFSDEIPALHLPIDYPRPLIRSLEGALVDFRLNPDESRALKDTAKQNEATIYMVILALFNILLAKLSGQEDIIVGTPILTRSHADLQEIIGMFVNTLALRNYPSREKDFLEFLTEVKHQTLAAYENQGYQFEDLVEKISVRRDTSRNPLFDVMLNVMTNPLQTPGPDAPVGENYVHRKGQSKVDLVLTAVDLGQVLHFRLEYCTKLFKAPTIERFIGYFKNILFSLTNNRKQALAEIEIITDEEKKALLDLCWGAAAPDVPEAVPSLQSLFEDRAEANPDRVAVMFERQHLSYRELNQRANQLARVLRKKGVKQNRVIGLMMDRSIEMIVGIWGILKAGGAYLPIDPEAPWNRIQSMLKDSNTTALLTTNHAAKKHSFTRWQGLRLSCNHPCFTGLPPQIMQEDFDRLPFPDRSLVDYEKYNRYIGQAMVKHCISLQATRGCPYNCAYCHKIWPKAHVFRSAENIFQEVLAYYRMGVRRFAFVDDIFNLNIENSRRFFQLILENELDLQLFFPNGMRGDILSRDYIDLMVKAGTVNLALALETASPRLQKLIGKNLNLPKLRENIEYLCQKYPQVILELFTMHGFPGETPQEAQMTLDFIKSLEWIHFPYVFILKIYPDTEMEKLALAQGVSPEAIAASEGLAYHELPDTLPFDKSFTLKYQAEFLNEYFLLKERLVHVLPYQMKILSQDELVQKYNSYLPVEIKSFPGLLQFAGISEEELNPGNVLDNDFMAVPQINREMRRYFPVQQPIKNALKVLLLDLSQFFSRESDILYDVVDPPLGLMYVMTYLKDRLGNRVNGKIAKSRLDFDNYFQLKALLEEFKPDVIGVRTLTFYKDFFHKTLSIIKQWGFDVPIIAGGPYATSSYRTMLQDKNIDVAVIGEGERTFHELIEKIIENKGELPGEDILNKIPGIAFMPPASASNREVLLLDEFPEAFPESASDNLVKVNNAAELAYVLFTSGSTGKPKGVMVEHKNLTNLVMGLKERIYNKYNPGLKVALLAPYIFDASVQQIFGALLLGHSLHIIPGYKRFEGSELLSFYKEQCIEISDGTPAHIFLLSAYAEASEWSSLYIKHFIIGGEALSRQIVEQFFHQIKKYRGPGEKIPLITNIYGPAECCVDSTSYDISAENVGLFETIPIGTPLPNQGIYIVDRSIKFQPIGVAGELCIGGANVGRGYLNNPELTFEKFLFVNYRSYGSYKSYNSNRIYKTGDLARWLADGNIECLGRIDYQVKIRGFRIEIGEIENQLLKHEEIKEAAVLAIDNKKAEKYLCAYIVSNRDLLASGLREYLLLSLPDYMVPSFFVPIEKIPLTPNGKIDRSALPEPGIRRVENYVPPGDAVERRLVEIWSEVLETERDVIGIENDFFQLGGHSLKAAIMVGKVHKAFNIRLPLTEIFRKPNIKGLSEYIKKSKKETYAAIEPVEKKEYYVLSAAQKRLYFEQQMDLESTQYNLPKTIILKEKPDEKKLTETFRKLIDRHESLRTSFELIGEEPVQRVHQKVEFEINYCKTDEKEVKEDLRRFERYFDLSKAPLLRVNLLNIKKLRYVLLVDMHHIITDGISNDILEKDFQLLYQGEDLLKLKLQYKDYAGWQKNRSQQAIMKPQEEYWLKQFEKEVPVLNLPTRGKVISQQDFIASGIDFIIGKEETNALRELVSRQEVTMFMAILAVYNILLSKISGKEDIVIGTPAAGRRHVDLERIIGMFVNTLALRNCPNRDKAFTEFLKEIKERTLEVFENQDYQLEDLVRKLANRKNPGHNSIFNVTFVFQNQASQAVDISGLENFQPYDYTSEAIVDLVLLANETRDHLLLTFVYSKSRFEPGVIKNFITFFKEILSSVILDEKIKIKDIKISHQLYDKKLEIPGEEGDFVL
jgi:amino acid adenylation domain-containing protein